MSILFLAEGVVRPKLHYRNISVWINSLLQQSNHQSGNLNFIFCSDDFLLDINRRFLSHDYFTDIITFDYSVDKIISGDMFISVDRVKENSLLFNCIFNDEVLRVIIHGILHLLGYNDASDDEKDVMRKLEDEYVLMFKLIDNANSK